MFSTDHHYKSSSSHFQRPRTAIRSSSPRVPVSKTAAYSWLQVQKIMESSGQPKSESSENEPATDNEQPSMMAALPRARNNLSASSSSSSLNSSVSSDSFSADVSTNANENENENESDKSVADDLSSSPVAQGKNSHNRIWDPET